MPGVDAATIRFAWPDSFRIIRSIYPPVDLFEDLLADPSDWELLAAFEAKTNPRLADAVGNLLLVPPARRVHGPTASLAMGCFTHVSPDRPSRFSDGRHGVWYCGDSVAVALWETAHHFERFMRATAEPAADADFRLLRCAVTGTVAVAGPDCLDPDDWSPGQRFAAAVRAAGTDGILYDSVRRPGGSAAALFWPDCLRLPITQDRHLRYRWNGTRMTHVLEHGRPIWHPWPPAPGSELA
ncbi:MAG: RES family NAD+ phosphorylase [Gluconacetobacter diazotrophicus]|nr:RES family NAD+ phosphorylase [Gluconacetobacter diazotrophicus]